MGLYEDTQEEIKEALKELERMEGDPKLREEYEALEYEIREKGSRIHAAKEEGIREGRKLGKEEEQKRLVQTMYKKKMYIEEICKYTELSKEEVEKIIKENN